MGLAFTGEGLQLSANLEEAVSAAEGGVVALMTPNGSWASGIVVSAAHGYILTVAHLLSERSQPPAQQPGQRSQPVSSQPSRKHSHCVLPERNRLSEGQYTQVIKQHQCGSAKTHSEQNCLSEGLDMGCIRQHHCSSAKTHSRRKGDVLVQIQVPEHASHGKDGPILNRQSGNTRLPEGRRSMSWASASLIYSFKGPLDVAVLQLDDLSLSSSLHDVSLRPAGVNAAGQGERVAVMGFPLLSPRLGLGSCVTAGIIAKVSAVCLRVTADPCKVSIPFEDVQVVS